MPSAGDEGRCAKLRRGGATPTEARVMLGERCTTVREARTTLREGSATLGK